MDVPFLSRKTGLMGKVGAIVGGETRSNTMAVAEKVRRRVNAHGDRLWTLHDFPNLPSYAVAKTLFRMEKSGQLKRVRKGVYYRPRMTIVGPSLPSREALIAKVTKEPLHASGLTAAAYLGFTTQTPMRLEYATSASNPPTGLRNAVVHTRRPIHRRKLTEMDGAILEFLRDRGKWSDLSEDATIDRTITLLRDAGSFTRLAKASASEPPRVRAILGSLGEDMGVSESMLRRLRSGLNPLSRYDFGVFSKLKSAAKWNAKL